MYTTAVFQTPIELQQAIKIIPWGKSCNGSRWSKGRFSHQKQANNISCSARSKNTEMQIRRSPPNFHPSLWGDHFISFSSNSETMDGWHKEAGNLKEKIKEKLIKVFETKSGLGEQLKMIDTIQRLGIAYHFEEEIEQALNRIFNDRHLHEPDVDNDELLIAALRFRILREHGYNASSDIFNKFKDGEHSFKEARNVEDLLALYEATHLRVHGEDILEEALEFTRTKLQEMASHLKPSLAKQVLNALSRPMQKALPRILAREFMSFYKESELYDEVLLKFAVLDFNILQKQHQQELSIISKWWRTIDIGVNFPFARDRMVECYFWALGACYQPQYALVRKFVTKVSSMITIVDDIYDIHGTHAELELFTRAIQRWEIHAMDELPDYMKIYYQALLEAYREMEEELSETRRSFTVNYAKEAKKNLVKTYHKESKLLQRNKTPTIEEYLKIAIVSVSYELMIAASFVGMGEIATKEAFEWLKGGPQIVRAASLICRLMNDIASRKYEQQREHVPSAVECYMHQHGVSEEKACEDLKEQIENAWKDINEGLLLLDAKAPTMPLLTCILNLARVPDLVYKEDDGFSNSTTIKHYLDLLLIDPAEI